MNFGTRGRVPFPSILPRIALVYIVVFIPSGASRAELSYDFVQDGTGDVLATLELSKLPATHNELNGLTFTPTGEALFGYTSPYTGSFTSSTNLFSDDGMGRLVGQPANAFFRDDSPIESTHQISGTFRVDLFIHAMVGELSSIDVIPSSLSDPFIYALGRWQSVPTTPLPCTPINALLGDFDADGAVAFADFLALSANFGSIVDDYADGDIDCDGNVSFGDFLVLSANFGQTLETAEVSTVPEPSTTALGLIASVSLFICARHSHRKKRNGIQRRE